MELNINVDTDALIANLHERYHNQLPFAVSKGINQTAKDIQAAIRAKLTQTVVTRTPKSTAWISRLVKINRGDWATKESLVARVAIGPRGFSEGDAKTLLPMVDQGGVRTSRMQIGHGAIFAQGSVAVPLRTSVMEVIPRYMYPSALGLQAIRSIGGTGEAATFRAGRGKHSRRKVKQRLAGMLMKGTNRTFLIKTKKGEGLLLQRTGPGGRGGKGQITGRAWFIIKPSVTVHARRFFHPTAQATAKGVLTRNLQDALALAMASTLRKAVRQSA
jgi:hypothetical protein